MSKNSSIRAAKLLRIRSGKAPRTLELCSGCGGMSLGLKTGGFALAAHAEADAIASASYALNFAPSDSQKREVWSKPRDILTCSPQTLVADFGLEETADTAFDVLAAGLPCQAFARIGRSKLGSISGDEHAFKKDERATLYRRFLEYVRTTQPVAILIENVPDILNFGGHNIPEEICETLDTLGYTSRYTLLNAAYYGVPQLRERLFLVAIDASLNASPTFPEPTHAVQLPPGYEGSRGFALKHVRKDASHFHPIPEPKKGLNQAVTVRDALRDLPFISTHFVDPAEMRKRHVSDLLPYRVNKGLSDYAHEMRVWLGFETHGTVDGHVVRLTKRDYPIFHRMPHGADYPEALEIAEQLFREKLESFRPRTQRPREKSRAYSEIRGQTIPPYDPDKFPNKWWKLDPSAPSRTLTAHIGKDTYSHIHYDSRQKRSISVREAARLQSFPDGFRFAGAMNATFRQIGNAVPPLLSLAVARCLMAALLKAHASVEDKRKRLAA